MRTRTVCGNGISIDPAGTDRVFNVFQRLHSSKEYEGAGIGLALCRRIIERHGGRIWIDSERASGTAVRFTLSLEEIDHGGRRPGHHSTHIR